MRHAERQDEVEDGWDQREASRQGGRPWDPPLSSRGVEQALEAAQRILQLQERSISIQAVVVSPFTRCLQTAAAAGRALGLPLLHLCWPLSEMLCRVQHPPSGPLHAWMWNGAPAEAFVAGELGASSCSVLQAAGQECRVASQQPHDTLGAAHDNGACPAAAAGPGSGDCAAGAPASPPAAVRSCAAMMGAEAAAQRQASTAAAEEAECVAAAEAPLAAAEGDGMALKAEAGQGGAEPRGAAGGVGSGAASASALQGLHVVVPAVGQQQPAVARRSSGDSGGNSSGGSPSQPPASHPSSMAGMGHAGEPSEVPAGRHCNGVGDLEPSPEATQPGDASPDAGACRAHGLPGAPETLVACHSGPEAASEAAQVPAPAPAALAASAPPASSCGCCGGSGGVSGRGALLWRGLAGPMPESPEDLGAAQRRYSQAMDWLAGSAPCLAACHSCSSSSSSSLGAGADGPAAPAGWSGGVAAAQGGGSGAQRPAASEAQGDDATHASCEQQASCCQINSSAGGRAVDAITPGSASGSTGGAADSEHVDGVVAGQQNNGSSSLDGSAAAPMASAVLVVTHGDAVAAAAAWACPAATVYEVKHTGFVVLRRRLQRGEAAADGRATAGTSTPAAAGTGVSPRRSGSSAGDSDRLSSLSVSEGSDGGEQLPLEAWELEGSGEGEQGVSWMVLDD